MSSVNRAILLGNVGKDPEIRHTQDGKKIASLTLATSESWKDKATGEKREKTEWHRISIFNEGLAGVVEKYVQKGSKLYVEGVLQTRKWTDQSGIERYTTEIVLQGFGGNLVLLDSKDKQTQQPERNNGPVREDGMQFGPHLDDDEIPY